MKAFEQKMEETCKKFTQLTVQKDQSAHKMLPPDEYQKMESVLKSRIEDFRVNDRSLRSLTPPRGFLNLEEP